MEKEIWKDVQGYEGYYQVSNLGRVKRLEGSFIGKGNKPIKITSRIKKPYQRGDITYSEIKLVGRKKEVKPLCLLVAETFLNKKEDSIYPHHLDGDLKNNKVSNLRWFSQEGYWKLLNKEVSFEGEIWKDVKGFEGIYKVSNLGRVVGLYRTVFVTPTPKLIKGGILSTTLQNNGYLRVGLRDNGKKRLSKSVHRIVLHSFNPVDNYEELQVNHINGIKSDNNLDNLEWCTASENQIHALRTGLSTVRRGENSNYSKLNNKSVLEIRHLFKKGINDTEISKKYAVSRGTISFIRRGITWTHI